MSENIIFSATSNVLGDTKFRVLTVEAPHSILEGCFIVESLSLSVGVSHVLSRNEIRELRDALSSALTEMEITDIVRLLK